MRIGVIAGTATDFHLSVARQFEGVEAILHAGNIGSRTALDALEAIAPVHAVVGQRDYLEFGDVYPEAQEITLGGARILMSHLIGTPPDLLAPIQRRLEDNPPDVVVHGHPPTSQVLWIGGTLFLAPGHASHSLTKRHATCALVEIEGPGRITAHVLEVTRPGEDSPYVSNPFFVRSLARGLESP